MTNLEVLRAVQHAWPGYCWPFANSAGNGYNLASSPSPPGSTMSDSNGIVAHPDNTTSGNHNQGLRSRSQSLSYQQRSSYEDQLRRMTGGQQQQPSPPSITKTLSPAGVKTEPLSPDSANSSAQSEMNALRLRQQPSSLNNATAPSPSTSPKSQSSNRTRTPSSFPGTPPHPAFTPPLTLPPGCFSPAGLGNFGSMSALPGVPGNLSAFSRASNYSEPPMPRNCSDLMRSLAAKYNGNPSGVNNATEYTKALQQSPVNSMISSKQSYQTANTSSPRGIRDPASPGTRNSPDDSWNKNNFNSSDNLHKSPPPPLLPVNMAHQNPYDIAKSLSRVPSSKALLDTLLERHISANIKNNILHNSAAAQYQNSDRVNIDVENLRSPSPKINRTKRSFDSSHPLDLSSSVSSKRAKTETFVSDEASSDLQHPIDARLSSNPNSVSSPSQPASPPAAVNEPSDNILTWTVEDVQKFVKSIDLCAEYAEVFEEQRIDGYCLSLLTEKHLTTSLKMKLGPALKLKSILSSRTVNQPESHSHNSQHCNSCHSNNTDGHNDKSIDYNSNNYSERSPSHRFSESPNYVNNNNYSEYKSKQYLSPVRVNSPGAIES